MLVLLGDLTPWLLQGRACVTRLAKILACSLALPPLARHRCWEAPPPCL